MAETFRRGDHTTLADLLFKEFFRCTPAIRSVIELRKRIAGSEISGRFVPNSASARSNKQPANSAVQNHD